ncbi:MAG: hypothetical protein MJ097_00565 [Dorea sp.]|nr:hypothetical protein [Dorea sp.]
MAKRVVINKEKFLKWLDERIVEEYAEEAKASKVGDYPDAFKCANARNVFKYVKLSITGEFNTDIGDFLEEIGGTTEGEMQV